MGTLDLSTRVISTSPHSLCIGGSAELQNPRFREPGNPGTRKPKNPELGNSESGNPGTRKPKNPELGNENMGTRTWKCGNPEHGCPNLETHKLGNQNMGIRNTDTRHMEQREPGKPRTWECGNLRGPVKRHDLGQTTTCRVSMG